MARCVFVIPGLLALSLAGVASAQLRVATWNLTEYASGEEYRSPAFQTAIFGEYQGRSMKPDVIVVQEIESSGPTTFLNLLNSAAGSPGDYAMAPFVDGNDSDSACFYRTSKLDLIATVTAVTGAQGSTNPVRNVMSYKLRTKGFTSDAAGFYLLSCHLKASEGSDNVARRFLEADRIRTYLETLPAGSNFMLAGDFNLYSTSEAGWIELIGSQANNNGRLFDPIHRETGSWRTSSAAAIQTQSPDAGSGGMDDRFDFILISDAMRGVDAISYVGNPNVAFGNAWNDPNHSYRVWGNDATSFNQGIKVSTNTMVGPAIAQALVNSYAGTNSPPHLPVLLDVQVPARVGVSTAAVDFGVVPIGGVAEQTITIENTTSVALFSKAEDGSGIDTLNYTLSASAGFMTPAGPFIEPAGDDGSGGNTHAITMDTSTAGVFDGTLTISSDDPDEPAKVITLHGVVIANFDYDANGDGLENVEDLYAWHEMGTDVDGNTQIEPADLVALYDHLREQEPADIVNGRR